MKSKYLTPLTVKSERSFFVASPQLSPKEKKQI